MNTKTCPSEDCRNGYHVRGTKKTEHKDNVQPGQQAPPAAECLVNYPALGTGKGSRGAAKVHRGATVGPWGAATASAPETPAP